MKEWQDLIIWAIGFLVISNLGVIVTLAVWGGKAVWWASNINSEVSKLTKEMDAAHRNIRQNREKISKLELKNLEEG